MNFWLQRLPTAEDVEQIIDTQSLTVWDFVWAFLVILGSFFIARLVRRILRRFLERFENLSTEGTLLIARGAGWPRRRSRSLRSWPRLSGPRSE